MLNVASALGSGVHDPLLLRGAVVVNPRRLADRQHGPSQRIRLPSGNYYWVELDPSEVEQPLSGKCQLDEGAQTVVHDAIQRPLPLPLAAATLAAHALWNARNLTSGKNWPLPEGLSKPAQVELPTTAQLLAELEALDERLLQQIEERAPPALEVVLDQARRLVSPAELAERRAREDRFRTRVAEADTLWAHGARRAALLLLRGRGEHSRDGRIEDLASERERELIAGPDLSLSVDGVHYRVMFGSAIWLGRGARIDVPSPIVSRTQLLFSRDEHGPTVADKGFSPESIGAASERLIAGGIRTRISSKDSGALVEIAETKYWLALADQLTFGTTQLRLSEAAARPVCQLSDNSGFILTPRNGSPRRVLACDLARGDRLSFEGGRTIEVRDD